MRPVAKEKPKRSADPATDAPVRTKSEIAKASATRVDYEIQRYAEEFNEPRLAKTLGGFSLKDNQPVDIVVFKSLPKDFKPGETLDDKTFNRLSQQYGIAHAVELKTIVSNKANKLTMKKSAMAKKRAFDRKYKTRMATVVFGDSKVFNAKGQGQHDVSQREIRFRTGYGSFRVDGMHKVESSKELLTLLGTEKRLLPQGAK